jgi:hypothetical protein
MYLWGPWLTKLGKMWTLRLTKLGLALVDYPVHSSLWIWSTSLTAVSVGHDEIANFRIGLGQVSRQNLGSKRWDLGTLP